MFGLNYSPSSDGYWQNIWKVLVYDDFCRDIIAPLFSVDDLQKAGVTLLLLLNGQRQEILEVPAIYFVRPTKENITKICTDCTKKLYENYYLNFVSSLPRELLEDLARSALESDSVKQISKIHDQYLDFISLEDSLFMLNQKDSYFSFHNPQITEADAIENINFVVDSLFSVFVTLGQVPIIQCPKGGPPEEIAKRLDQKIRDQLKSVPNLFTELENPLEARSASFQRPVLLLVDRNIDLSIMLSHSWTYQSLIHDFFDLHLNRIKLDLEKKQASYTLDSNDVFFGENSGSDLPSTLRAIKEFCSSVEKKKKKALDATETTTTKNMHEQIALLPELEKEKEIAAKHVDIAEQLLKGVNERNLDIFFKLEEEIMTHAASPSYILDDVLEQHGTAQDKLRLFLIYYLAKSKKMTKEELSSWEGKLTKLGCDVAPFKFLLQTKAFDQHWATATTLPQQSTAQDYLFDMFSSIVTKGIQTLIPLNKDYYVTRLINSVMDLTDDKDTKDFLYFDPKFAPNSPKKTTPFKEAVVFVIGGGNYLEYQNIQDFLKKRSQQNMGFDRKVIYGTTEMLNGKMFLEQLSALGRLPKK